MPNNRALKFEQNIPVQLALQTTQGLRIARGRSYEMLFCTVSGQKVYMPEEAATRLQAMVRSDEPFFICKRRGRYDLWLSNGAERARAAEEAPEVAKQLRSPRPAGEGVGGDRGGDAAPSAAHSFNEPAGTEAEPRQATPPVIPFPTPSTRRDERELLKPTGTDSLPVPALQEHGLADGEVLGHESPKVLPVRIRPASITKQPPPGRVSYQSALEHICKSVKQALCNTGIVLGDGPTQDLISTVFIAAQKEKAIDFDFGEAA